MLALRTKPSETEKAKTYLLKHRGYNKDYKILNKNPYIYLPLASDIKPAVLSHASRAFHAKAIETKLEPIAHPTEYRKSLMSALGSSYEKAVKSYDLFGNIAVIDAEPQVALKMSKVILSTNKNVETVLRKGGAVSGVYRTRKHAYVAGKRNYIATYKENGCTFVFDVRKVFFSTRLAYERDRISKLVKSKENVIVMFAGAGPFAIEIAKRQPKANVIAMELNPYGCTAMRSNIKLNKTDNVSAERGDVAKLSSKHPRFANRVIMPLPKTAFEYLKDVAKVAANSCVMHYYAFGQSDSVFETESKRVVSFFTKAGFSARVLNKRVVRPYSSREVEICLDVSLKRDIE